MAFLAKEWQILLDNWLQNKMESSTAKTVLDMRAALKEEIGAVRTWEICDLNTLNLAEVTQLAKEVFNSEMDEKGWHWKFKDNPCPGTHVLGAVDKESRALIGLQALCARSLKVNDQNVRLHLSTDTMVSKEFRRKGIVTDLCLDILNRVDHSEIALVGGLPNENSARSMLKLGGVEKLFILPVFFRVLQPEKIARQFLGTGILSWLASRLAAGATNIFAPPRKARSSEHIETATRFDERVNELFHKASKHIPVCVIRSCTYLNWRFCDRPDSNYTFLFAGDEESLRGYLVLAKMQIKGLNIGIIADLLAEEEQVGTDLLAEAIKRCQQEGLDAVISIFSAPQAYRNMYSSAGFLSSRFSFAKRSFLFITIMTDFEQQHPEEFKKLSGYLRNPDNWLLTLGDGDIV